MKDLSSYAFARTGVDPQSGGFLYETQSIQIQDGGDEEVHGNDLAIDPAETSQSPFPCAVKAVGLLSRILGVPR